MKRLRIHPGVYDDIAEALATTRELFGGRQVALYAKLIIKARQTLREQPTIGQLREDLGPGVRVFCIAGAPGTIPTGPTAKGLIVVFNALVLASVAGAGEAPSHATSWALRRLRI